MAWPPSVSELRQEVATDRSDESLHRILQSAVDVVHSYDLTDAISEQEALKLAVVDVQFDALRQSSRAGGLTVTKNHREARNSILRELGRLRRRQARGLAFDGPSVPQTAASPTGNAPIQYLTYHEWELRAQSTTLPVAQAGSVNTARVDALLDDASSWCAATIPGYLIRGGHLLPTGDVPQALLAVLKQVCFALVAQWLAPRHDKWMEDCSACEQRAAQRLRDAARSAVGMAGAGGDEPETPITPPVTTVTRYLLASVDQTFTAVEAVLHDTSGATALMVPPGTVPAGESRYIAYGRPASLGDYTTAYWYPAGHPSTLNVIGAYLNGPDLDIAGVSVRLLRSRAPQRDSANGRIFDAR